MVTKGNVIRWGNKAISLNAINLDEMTVNINNKAQELTLAESINIHAPVSKVWDALIDPELIKIYFFGTECITDWKKGSPIIFKGTYEGKAYVDKGNILNIETGKFILYNYWSSFSGTEDIPANYSVIKYELSANGDEAVFTVTQEGFKTKEAHDHSVANWRYIMDGLKNMLEK